MFRKIFCVSLWMDVRSVVGEQVEHPRCEGVEAVEPPAKVVEEAYAHLDRGVLRSIFLEPPGIFKPLTTG